MQYAGAQTCTHTHTQSSVVAFRSQLLETFILLCSESERFCLYYCAGVKSPSDNTDLCGHTVIFITDAA